MWIVVLCYDLIAVVRVCPFLQMSTLHKLIQYVTLTHNILRMYHVKIEGFELPIDQCLM